MVWIASLFFLLLISPFFMRYFPGIALTGWGLAVLILIYVLVADQWGG